VVDYSKARQARRRTLLITEIDGIVKYGALSKGHGAKIKNIISRMTGEAKGILDSRGRPKLKMFRKRESRLVTAIADDGASQSATTSWPVMG